MIRLEANFPGVEIEGNTILFNNESMSGKVDDKMITLYRERVFDTIFIGYKKM